MADQKGYLTTKWFVTTEWRTVLAAAEDESPSQGAALENLCRGYWPPIYAFIRRMGYGPHDAQDLTQTFFMHLIERKAIQSAQPDKGKFRSFLLAALKLFLRDEWRRNRAIKRGGTYSFMSLESTEVDMIDRQHQTGGFEKLTAEELYDFQWALTLLDLAYRRMEQDFLLAQKAHLFDALKPFLSRIGDDREYARAGDCLGMSSGAVGTAVHRLRKRFGEIIREEITRTVNEPAEVELELDYLVRLLGNQL